MSEHPATAIGEPESKSTVPARGVCETAERLPGAAGEDTEAAQPPGAASARLREAEEKLRRAEAALRESEERFQGTFEQAAVGLAHVSAEGRFLRVNAKLCAILGYAREELMELTFAELTVPEDLAECLEAHRAMLAGEQTAFTADQRYRRKSGEEVWINLVTTLERTAAGEPKYFISVLADITLRKQGEAALRVSEERFQLLAKATNDAIWDWNVDADEMWWNENFDALFGFHAEENERTLAAWMSRLHPEDEKRVLEQYYVLIGKGSSIFSCEYRFRRKDGGYAYVLDRGHIIRNAAGKAVRMIGGMTDLTERRRAEERIAEQAALIDKAQDAILVRDLEHRVTYWNQSAERIFGWNAEEVIDLSARELFYADPASFDQAMSELLERGDWTGELSMLTKDEHKITVESRWTLVHDAEGRPRSVLVINTDCTDRKKIEQQFLRAQRMESIGTLAGGIAHDLNNVLGPIIMALDLLRMRFPDQASQDLLAVVGNSARHGADMVSQVLSFARGVEGRRMEVQIKHLVSGVEKIANDTFLKHVLVQTIVPPDLWTVLGDPTQLHQVLLNLCVNARDAMPDGGTLTISAENLLLDAHYAGLNPEAQPGPYIALHVEDTGTGMPPDVIQKIFDPFFTTKELGKGTGLGLSSSMAIVKSHRGFLRVYSEPGNGTKFIVYLPAETEISQAAAVVLEAEIPRGEGELILVVDDEDSVRQITRQTLEAFGYRVILACDGVEAVEIYTAQAAEIAAVLTDMMMPIMDGPATIHVLRKMNPAAKIICASGLAANSQLAESASLGVKHFLPKPYSAETLLKILRQILTGDQ